jgi:hypothetical protein
MEKLKNLFSSSMSPEQAAERERYEQSKLLSPEENEEERQKFDFAIRVSLTTEPSSRAVGS